MTIQTVFYNTRHNHRQFELPRGTRPWNMLLVLTQGSFRCTIEGEEQVIGAKEIAFFPMNMPFTRQVLEPISFYQFAFHADTTHPFFRHATAGRLAIPHEEVASMIQRMEQVLHLEDNREQIVHTVEHILAQHDLYTRHSTRGINGYPRDIQAVMQFMQEHLSEKLDIDDLAAYVHLSHVGLLWKFKRYTGNTLSHYLIRLRIHNAKQLLLEGDLPICEIAALCGYSNPYYFSGAFRRETGFSPSEYRRTYTAPPPTLPPS